MQHTTKIILQQILSFLLIVLFVYTGFSKLVEPDYFRAAVAQSLLIRNYSDSIVWLIPLFELSISVMLLLPEARYFGFLASFILMCAFTLYVAIMLVTSNELPCTCGGVIQKMSWPQHLAFNIFFTTVAYLGWRNTEKKQMKAIKIVSTDLL